MLEPLPVMNAILEFSCILSISAKDKLIGIYLHKDLCITLIVNAVILSHIYIPIICKIHRNK